ncbi:MAG: gamma-glutamyltransferase family protein [Candidatus Eremiobacteraeota bacterium]|nr:gamma-glutamyltransferase family protein [Candidatus Eremiobacteraeota bacterium]
MSFGTSFALTTRPTVMGRHGAIVAGHQLAAQAGLAILRAGGNAVDAAIAAAAALAVLKPDACGLGSDLFLLRAGPRGELDALNASGPAPALAELQKFGREIEPHGLRAASVPGAVSGWDKAVERFGKLSLAAVLAPAIELATRGIPVSSFFAATLEKNEPLLRRFPATHATFHPQGRPPRAGEVLVQTDLGQTLEAIASGGARAFYAGAFAAALDRASRDDGALLRKEDLEGYESEWLEPLRGSYHGFELVGQPPVSVGAAVLEAMQILERLPIGETDDCSAEFIHLQVESMKAAMRDVRATLGDPRFVAADATALLEPRIAEERAASLFARAGTDTSYVAAIDAEGNAVSLLQSVFHVWGSAVVVPRTGVLMNNRMTGFSLDPGSPNVLEPRKRPLNTLNPLIVRRDGKTLLCLGTPGGPSQTYTNAILLLRILDRGIDLQRAVDEPRWFVTPQGKLHIESSIAAGVREELALRGHDVVAFPPHSAAMGGAGVVRLNADGVREAAADPRRETYALAY